MEELSMEQGLTDLIYEKIDQYLEKKGRIQKIEVTLINDEFVEKIAKRVQELMTDNS